MEFETICDVSEPILYVFFFGVPAWLIFYPPRKLRVLSNWYRPFAAILVAQAGIYALFFGFVYPATDAYRRAYENAHPDSSLFLDGILLFEPSQMWPAVAVYTVFCFVVRGIYLACASRTTEANSRHGDLDA